MNATYYEGNFDLAPVTIYFAFNCTYVVLRSKHWVSESRLTILFISVMTSSSFKGRVDIVGSPNVLGGMLG